MAAQVQMRPQLFTFILMAALVWLLARDSYRGAGGLWLAVPIMVAWANFHGAYIAGLGALGTYAAVASIQGIIEQRGWRRAGHLSLIVIASVFATLVNPYGVGAWYAVWHALTNPLTRSVINDWKPVTSAIAGLWKTYLPGVIMFVYAILFLAALAVGVALAPRGNDLPLVVVAVVFSVAALTSLRNLSLAVIVTSVPMARHFGLAWRQRWAGGAGRPERQTTPVHTAREQSDRSAWDYVGPLFAAAAALFLIVDGLFSSNLEAIMQCPVGAVAFMKEHHLHGNVLSTYDWGEYLIWHIAPESKVFIDGRYDTVYPAEVIDDYFDFDLGFPDPDRVLKNYKHDFVLLPPASQPWKLVNENRDWKVIYEDENAVLFAPKDFAMKGVTIPVVGSAPPSIFP
jgi:hypothetical protein